MMKVVFFGTPTFAAETLKYLLDNHVNIVAVISKPDRPKGRSATPIPTPVKAVLLERKSQIPCFQPEQVSSLEFATILSSFQADLFVVVAYGEILKQHVLDMPRLACVNLHASLLPKYRGAAPIQRCIINGEKESGVTIMHMVRKMDAGDMIEKVTVPITENMTFGELELLLCEVGKVALLDVIEKFSTGKPLLATPQNHELATMAPKLELEDCEIHWNQPAQNIHNLVRGVNPYPGAWCFINIKGEKKRFKIIRTLIVDQPPDLSPGQILFLSKNSLIVATADQALQPIEVQLEGKKAMPMDEFLRGILPDQLSFQK